MDMCLLTPLAELRTFLSKRFVDTIRRSVSTKRFDEAELVQADG
jgi:hypothetical protein